MKKAYVKPVFLAEVFEGTASVAACERGSNEKFEVWNKVMVCDSPGHKIGSGNDSSTFKMQYLNYATDGLAQNGIWSDDYKLGKMGDNTGAYVFTSGMVVCDFLWDSKGGEISVWENTETKELISNTTKRSSFLESGLAGFRQLGEGFMSFFRDASAKCEPILDNGTPFSG